MKKHRHPLSVGYFCLQRSQDAQAQTVCTVAQFATSTDAQMAHDFLLNPMTVGGECYFQMRDMTEARDNLRKISMGFLPTALTENLLGAEKMGELVSRSKKYWQLFPAEVSDAELDHFLVQLGGQPKGSQKPECVLSGLSFYDRTAGALERLLDEKISLPADANLPQGVSEMIERRAAEIRIRRAFEKYFTVDANATDRPALGVTSFERDYGIKNYNHRASGFYVAQFIAPPNELLRVMTGKRVDEAELDSLARSVAQKLGCF